MKLLSHLSIVASLSLLNAFPCLALSQSDSRLSTGPSSRHSETVEVAGFFNDINNAIDTIDRVVDTVDRIEERDRAEQERQERLEAERQRQEELEAEAQQRRQYFESLSPEEQKAYLAEQRAMQQAQVDAAAALFLLLISSGGGGDNSSQASPADDYYWQEEPPSQTEPEPAYTPAPTIDPFYGDTHW